MIREGTLRVQPQRSQRFFFNNSKFASLLIYLSIYNNAFGVILKNR
jgi:hypothetical protein